MSGVIARIVDHPAAATGQGGGSGRRKADRPTPGGIARGEGAGAGAGIGGKAGHVPPVARLCPGAGPWRSSGHDLTRQGIVRAFAVKRVIRQTLDVQRILTGSGPA
ncbi:MAG: hypothetical protein LW715_09230 [Rhodobacter sp.]|jgi:hypothetical protein|nr:hypothetical protein [Rhodobacter sp.]